MEPAMNPLTFLLLVGILFSNTATSATIDDDLFDDDLPVVISASRLNQSVLTSPSSVTVIDKAMIEASGFIEFVDLLRLVPGFQVAHVDGRRYAAAYHGLGSDIGNRLQVLVNGRSTYTPTLSTVDWNLLGVELTDIQRIEVVRGSSASAYGSNSFTAAINIITQSPELDDTFYFHAREGNKQESQQVLRTSNTLDKLSYRVTASKRKNDGFDDYSDSRELKHIGIHSQLHHMENHPINIYLTLTDGHTGTNISDSYLQPRDKEVTSWSAHIQGQQILSNTQDIKWNFYHNSDKSDDLSESLPLSVLGVDVDMLGIPDQTFMDGDETNDATKTDFELTYNTSAPDSISYMIGSGIRYDTLRSISYFNEKGKVSDTTARAFGNLQVNLTETLTFNSGAIYEHVQSYIARTSSRASINWKLLPSQSLRIAASRGYRLPSLLERNFDKKLIVDNGLVLDELYISDPNLGPEKIDSYEIGYLGNLSRLPLSWDIKLYYDKIQHVYGFPIDRGFNDAAGNHIRTIENGGHHITQGIEGELIYRQNNENFFKFLFNIGESESEILQEINPEEIDNIDITMPRESYGLLASKTLYGLQLNLGAYYISQMEWLNLGDVAESYIRTDIGLAKTFKTTSGNIKIKLSSQNIEKDYIEFDTQRPYRPRYQATIAFTQH